jgi:hypothetical protein
VQLVEGPAVVDVQAIWSSGTHLPSTPQAWVSHSASSLHGRHAPSSQNGASVPQWLEDRHRTQAEPLQYSVSWRDSQSAWSLQISHVFVERLHTGSAAEHA